MRVYLHHWFASAAAVRLLKADFDAEIHRHYVDVPDFNLFSEVEYRDNILIGIPKEF